ncbi:hypothetical protein ACSMX9_28420 [Streptomyces sp. LE64]|uniref:hypothetical protein n=1 Tax=Streptomyces sp. LE64 TaxID=3448653 RepID=UPI004042B67D
MSDLTSREFWLGRAIDMGLTTLDECAPEGVPSVSQALLSVTNMEVRPARVIPSDSPGALDEADRQWLATARSHSLFTNDGKFLIALPGPGAVGAGWICVKWVDGAKISSRLSHRKENVDFMAMSFDGRSLCAVTEEDSEYWVVFHDFS